MTELHLMILRGTCLKLRESKMEAHYGCLVTFQVLIVRSESWVLFMASWLLRVAEEEPLVAARGFE